MIFDLLSPARISSEAAERLRELGALTPYHLTPPLPPLLIAAAAWASGLEEAQAALLVAALGWASGCAAVWALLRRFAGTGGGAWALAAAALAPAKWVAWLAREDLTRLLFWSLVPVLFLALDSFRRRPRWASAAAIAAIVPALAATHPRRAGALDLGAVLELVALAAVFLPLSRFAGRRGFRVALIAVFASTAAALGLFSPSRLDGPGPPAELTARVARDLALGAVVAPGDLEELLNPVLRDSGRLIRSADRPAESLLWLRARAARYVIARGDGKFRSLLECEARQDGWGLFRLPVPSSPAVIVSRPLGEKLHPIRGLLDVEGLDSYIEWALRPEAAGFARPEPARIEVEADLGPDDMVLVRVNAEPGWKAEASGGGAAREIPIRRDPLNFMLLDPGPGRWKIALRFDPALSERLAPRALGSFGLVGGEFPSIRPEGIVDALRFTPPPFSAGDYLTIFGRNFLPGGTRVRAGDLVVEPMWTGPRQINFRLPGEVPSGLIEIVVEAGGRASYPEPIEVGR